MAAAPPPLAPNAEPPMDRALSLALAGEPEAALRWAAALVKQDLTLPGPLMVLACRLAELGSSEAAVRGLELSIERAVDSGNLPMAIAACAELTRLGEDASPRLDAIAGIYGKGSPRLKDQATAPPVLPGRQPGFQPLPATLGGAALLEEAANVLDYAFAALDEERGTRKEGPPISPQPLFSSLTPDALRAMMGIFDSRVIAAGTVLIEEGTTGSEAFVVARGELEVSRRGPEGFVPLARLGNGALFGEMALLSRTPRAASVRAHRPSIVLVAHRDSLDQLASRKPEVAAVFASYCHRRMVQNLLRTSAILGALEVGERRALIDHFVTKTWEKGDVLIAQGQESAGLHLIASGRVSVRREDEAETMTIAQLGVGEVVGEVALVLRRPSNASVVADLPTVTLHLPRERFLDVIRQHPALLSTLYELAVRRDEETSSIVAQEATDADELILI